MGPRADTVLFVDDDENVLRAVERTLRHTPYHVLLASSPQEALRALGTRAIDVVVSDQRMPRMTGLELLAKVRERYPHTVRILFTAFVDQKTLLGAINEGEVFRFVNKPFHPPELLDVLKAASAKARRHAQKAPNDGRRVWPHETTSSSVKKEVERPETSPAAEDQPSWVDLEPEITAVADHDPGVDKNEISISEADFSAAWEQNILGGRVNRPERAELRRGRQSGPFFRRSPTGGSGPPNG